jgi:hypothetical protein
MVFEQNRTQDWLRQEVMRRGVTSPIVFVLGLLGIDTAKLLRGEMLHPPANANLDAKDPLSVFKAQLWANEILSLSFLIHFAVLDRMAAAVKYTFGGLQRHGCSVCTMKKVLMDFERGMELEIAENGFVAQVKAMIAAYGRHAHQVRRVHARDADLDALHRQCVFYFHACVGDCFEVASWHTHTHIYKHSNSHYTSLCSFFHQLPHTHAHAHAHAHAHWGAADAR